MIYNSALERAQDYDKEYRTNNFAFRMAIITAIQDGRPIIRFSGETKPSQKPYKRLAAYNPVVGDRVILAKLGGSYVILGKVV